MKVLYKLRSKFCQFANTKLGLRLQRMTPDRIWLNRFVKANCPGKTVLSIGTAWYTMHLPEIANAKLWSTIDRSEAAAMFASTSDVHYLLDLTKPGGLPGYLGMFDVVILNGVLGWGVDTEAEAKAMTDKLVSYMSKDSVLLVGYNSDRISWVPSAQGTELYDWYVADNKSKHTYRTFAKGDWQDAQYAI